MDRSERELFEMCYPMGMFVSIKSIDLSYETQLSNLLYRKAESVLGEKYNGLKGNIYDEYYRLFIQKLSKNINSDIKLITRRTDGVGYCERDILLVRITYDTLLAIKGILLEYYVDNIATEILYITLNEILDIDCDYSFNRYLLATNISCGNRAIYPRLPYRNLGELFNKTGYDMFLLYSNLEDTVYESGILRGNIVDKSTVINPKIMTDTEIGIGILIDNVINKLFKYPINDEILEQLNFNDFNMED